MISTPTIVEFNWPEPIPLGKNEQEASLPYPTECLPAIIREAVTSYQAYGKQPLPLVACSALANVSLACQTQANVARDRLLTSPISLYFLAVAESGSRKSSVDHTFSHAIRQWKKRKGKN